MPMSFFALHDLCPSDSFTKYGLLLIYGKLLRSGPDHLGLKIFYCITIQRNWILVINNIIK